MTESRSPEDTTVSEKRPSPVVDLADARARRRTHVSRLRYELNITAHSAGFSTFCGPGSGPNGGLSPNDLREVADDLSHIARRYRQLALEREGAELTRTMVELELHESGSIRVWVDEDVQSPDGYAWVRSQLAKAVIPGEDAPHE